MELSEIATRWTALAAMIGAAVVVGCRLLLVRRGLLRWMWTLSCAVFLLHVCCAFQFYHHWSHADAYESTAVHTEETVGVHTGAGLYLNYLFALLWPTDVAWWWRDPVSYAEQPRWLVWTFGVFFAFMAVNATIVFGGLVARIAGAVCVAGILLAVMYGERQRRNNMGRKV
jgi:O-antigen ligase